MFKEIDKIISQLPKCQVVVTKGVIEPEICNNPILPGHEICEYHEAVVGTKENQSIN